MVPMYYSEMKRVYIVSILKSKDYKKMLKILANDNEAKYVLTSGNDPERYVSGNDLYECMKGYVGADRIEIQPLESAILNTQNDEENVVNLVVGSFYVYGDVINAVRKMNKVKGIQ